jgi:hypothetical protein
MINFNIKNELYDEVIMFKMVNDKIDDVKSPFFVNPPRNENE